MNNGNGTATSTARDRDLTPTIAQSIIDSLQHSQPRGLQGSTAKGPSWLMFAEALDALVASSPALAHVIEEAMARSARLVLASQDAALPSVEEFVSAIRNPVTPRGGTGVRAFFWGFHIQISHQDLEAFLNTAEPVNALIGTIGGSIPGPAAPFIALAAAFVAGALGLLKSLDHGAGVYVSMSWFAPGIFIPTSV